MNRLATLALLACVLAAGLAAPVRAADGAWQRCAREIAAAESLRPELPAHLLTALSKVESGRWDEARQARVAWPWTVMAEGRGRYLPSKAAAIREVRQLQAKGVRNIDVGCMQVNLSYHGHAFDSLEQALDPTFNVAYAAEFLLGLHRKAGSWTRAIGDYHSQTPRYSGPYRLKVFRAWRAEKKAAYRAAAEARQAKATFARSVDGYLRDDRKL